MMYIRYMNSMCTVQQDETFKSLIRMSQKTPNQLPNAFSDNLPMSTDSRHLLQDMSTPVDALSFQ
jgi:hypothetical protein